MSLYVLKVLFILGCISDSSALNICTPKKFVMCNRKSLNKKYFDLSNLHSGRAVEAG